MPSVEHSMLNKILTFILDNHLHNYVAEWQSSLWTGYLELCRKQKYIVEISRKADNSIEKIYVHSSNTGATVGRYCEYCSDVTELGSMLGMPGTYEPVFDTFSDFVKKFYRVDISKLKPKYACQKRKTFS